MKIQGNNTIDGKELYGKVQELNKNQEAEKNEGAQKGERNKDKISLSGRAKEISELMGLIDKLPDVRMDKVEELKKAIDTGNYNFDSLKVAEKILEEI
ncbi:MAG TPA: flagellar biosynthesis anti-sigma factor FlgM [Nitrospiraceae bacterium]|jgi:negative regulator of flagellin synthesis FlgM|nr:flagellar biosynthesis anti-sigma factor FlgM [Nitrospiraceae bacterium]